MTHDELGKYALNRINGFLVESPEPKRSQWFRQRYNRRLNLQRKPNSRRLNSRSGRVCRRWCAWIATTVKLCCDPMSCREGVAHDEQLISRCLPQSGGRCA
jgi:hypothetical protein